MGVEEERVMPAALTQVLDLVAMAGDDAVGAAAALAEAALARVARRTPGGANSAAGRGSVGRHPRLGASGRSPMSIPPPVHLARDTGRSSRPAGGAPGEGRLP
jgi:hypothetical protein